MSSADLATTAGPSTVNMLGTKCAYSAVELERDTGPVGDTHPTLPTTPKATNSSQTVAKLLRGQEEEWAAVATKEGPLRLLDLPVVVLKEIVREVTSTNDLCALALTHPALHDLAIPYIYSRFDIVWPDTLAVTDTRTGVDALTYGLATLVMAQDVFGEAVSQQTFNHSLHRCSHCGKLDRCQHNQQRPQLGRKFRRGNNFAQHTRKFSLGNGPADWVQEYLITKESGKMLGTLVALAVGRMRNLEQFVWDMPTGVLRDVWAALASLGNRDDGQPCRLEKVWVRWHNNSDAQGETPSPNLLSALSPSGHPLPLFQIPAYPRVEFPTFSHLPSLKSLTVLDIDELSYVEEMSILIDRSRETLRELRIGLAHHAQGHSWATISSSKTDTLEPFASRSHGILGVLLAKIIEKIELPADPTFGLSVHSSRPSTMDGGIQHSSPCPVNRSKACRRSETVQRELRAAVASFTSLASLDQTSIGTMKHKTSEMNVPDITSALAKTMIEDTIKEFAELNANREPPEQMDVKNHLPSPPVDVPSDGTRTPVAEISDPQKQISLPTECEKRYAHQSMKLQLETLAFERVHISVPVLSRSIDWTKLTSITILRCNHHEQLWRALRKQFAPYVPVFSSSTNSRSKSTGYSSSKQFSSSRLSIPSENFPLQIKKLQADAVSSQLISFIKETLAPDSLEWLFLQEGRPYRSSVTIENIYKGAIRRHRGSLQKLLIDSEDRTEEGQPVPNNHWRRWTFNREILTFVTSGKMPHLRELGMSIEYKDWHFFLRRLPLAPQLRSLYIPYLADHVHGSSLDSRELALQVLDIVFLSPKIELCYLGIQTKCFEVLEFFGDESSKSGSSSHDFGGNFDDTNQTGRDGGGGGMGHDSESESDTAPHPHHGHTHHRAHHHNATISDTDSASLSPYASVSSDNEDDSCSQSSSASASPTASGNENSASESEQTRQQRKRKAKEKRSKRKKKEIHFKLREILFYDDKISIFKARHGKI